MAGFELVTTDRMSQQQYWPHYSTETATSTISVHVSSNLSSAAPTMYLGDYLPPSIAEGVDDALLEEKIEKLLEMCFDPKTFPNETFDFEGLLETIRRKISNAPDNLPELGDVQIEHTEEMLTSEAAVKHLGFLLSVPEHPSQFQQQAMFSSSPEPFLGAVAMNPRTFQIDMSSVFVGIWNSPQDGQCYLFAVPSNIPIACVSGAVVVGILKGNKVLSFPQGRSGN